MEKVMRVALYIRVSTEEQNLNGLSLPAQRLALTEYAQKNGYMIVGCYADEGISARKPMRHRKALLQLLEDVKQDRIDMILVTKLDRWFRNIADYNTTEAILEAHHCYWKTIFENYDTSTANGQMVINIMLSVNQAECDRTSERIKAVFDYKRAKGEVISGMMAPYGYVVENGKVVKDPETRAIVEDAYRIYFDTFSVKKVLARINECYANHPNKPTYNMIDRLFKNEKYTGRCKDDLNYCEPYITTEQFERIQKTKNARTHAPTDTTYLFSSLIKCPVCGCNFVGYRKIHQCVDGTRTIYIKYRCGRKYYRHSGAHLTEKNVEYYLIEHLICQIDSEIAVLESKLKRTQKTSGEDPKALEKELERLNLQFQKGRISENYYDEQYELLQNKLRKINDNSTIIKLDALNEKRRYFAGDWLSFYNQLDREHKKIFWKRNIEAIYVDADTHKICGFKLL